MAKASGIGQRLFVEGRDISGDVGSISAIRSTITPLDVTSIMDSAPSRIVGLRDAEISFEPWFNSATGETHDYLASLPTTDVEALVLTSTTLGQPTFAITAKQINYDWDRGADGSMTGSVQLLGNGFALETGLALTAGKVTHASTTDVTGIDFGSQTTSGAVGFLQHFSAASGTVEYDIEDSSDSTNGVDGSWTNLLAFTDSTNPWAPFAERVAVNGTVERWTRASTNGVFTTAVFSMALRRRGAGDFDAA